MKLWTSTIIMCTLFLSTADQVIAQCVQRYWIGASGTGNSWGDTCNWNDLPPLQCNPQGNKLAASSSEESGGCDPQCCSKPASGDCVRLDADDVLAYPCPNRFTADYLFGAGSTRYLNLTLTARDTESMTILKSGAAGLEIEECLLQGSDTSDDRAVLDIDQNGLAVVKLDSDPDSPLGTTTVTGFVNVDIATTKSADLRDIDIVADASGGPAELKKLGGGTLDANEGLRLEAAGSNNATLVLPAGSGFVNAPVVLEGAASADGIALVDVDHTLTVTSTAVQQGKGQIDIADFKIFTGNATSVDGESGTPTTLEITGLGKGEFKASTVNVTGATDGSVALDLLTGMLRTTGLVTLNNPVGPSISVSLLQSAGTIAELNSLDMGASTTVTAEGRTALGPTDQNEFTGVTVHGQLKVTGAATVQIGSGTQGATVEAGSLVIQAPGGGSIVWQPTFVVAGSKFVTR